MGVEEEKVSELRKCPSCGDAWIFRSDMTYGSDYENLGFRVNCKCGYAWQRVEWQKTKEEAIEEWNRRR